LEIAAIHAESRQRYGSPRIHAELADRGCRTSRKRVARLMRARGLAARRRQRFRVTTQSHHRFPIAPNRLARQFERAHPDQAWVTDITYIPTGEGWLYLAVILDLCSRVAVGWAMSARITDDLTLNALGMALARRRPPQGLLHHSDRGSQPKFNRSSQHRTERGCDDDTKKACGMGRTRETTLARPALGSAA
jgi:transposase InsO family protein